MPTVPAARISAKYLDLRNDCTRPLHAALFVASYQKVDRPRLLVDRYATDSGHRRSGWTFHIARTASPQPAFGHHSIKGSALRCVPTINGHDVVVTAEHDCRPSPGCLLASNSGAGPRRPTKAIFSSPALSRYTNCSTSNPNWLSCSRMQIATVALEREVTELMAISFCASSRQSICCNYSKLTSFDGRRFGLLSAVEPFIVTHCSRHASSLTIFCNHIPTRQRWPSIPTRRVSKGIQSQPDAVSKGTQSQPDALVLCYAFVAFLTRPRADQPLRKLQFAGGSQDEPQRVLRGGSTNHSQQCNTSSPNDRAQ